MNEIDQIESQLISSFKEISDLKGVIQKKEQEKQDLFNRLILGIIDVIDTYYRVINSLTEKGLDESDIGSKVITRYNNVLKKLHKLLKENGVVKLEFPDNKLIIGSCKVVDTEPNSSKENDEIISIVRDGYIRGNELMREAELIIVKN